MEYKYMYDSKAPKAKKMSELLSSDQLTTKCVEGLVEKFFDPKSYKSFDELIGENAIEISVDGFSTKPITKRITVSNHPIYEHKKLPTSIRKLKLANVKAGKVYCVIQRPVKVPKPIKEPDVEKKEEKAFELV